MCNYCGEITYIIEGPKGPQCHICYHNLSGRDMVAMAEMNLEHARKMAAGMDRDWEIAKIIVVIIIILFIVILLMGAGL